MNATELAKSFIAICAAIGLFCSIVGSSFWGVTNVLAQISAIEDTQKQQVQNTAAIQQLEAGQEEIKEEMSKNQNELKTLLLNLAPPPEQ